MAKRWIASTWARRLLLSTGQSVRFGVPTSGWSGARLLGRTVCLAPQLAEEKDITGRTNIIQVTPVLSALSSATTSLPSRSVPPSASCSTPPTSKQILRFYVSVGTPRNFAQTDGPRSRTVRIPTKMLRRWSLAG